MQIYVDPVQEIELIVTSFMCAMASITAVTGKMFFMACLVAVYVAFCKAQDEYDVRLSDSTTPGQGTVEVFYNGAWGTVCRDSSWDFLDAFVVCKQLGYNWVNGSSWEDRIGTGSGSVVLGGVQCTGSEVSLDLCPNGGWGQQECSDEVDTAAVSCGSMDGYSNATAVLGDGLRPSFHSVVTEGNAHLRFNAQDSVYVIQDHNWDPVNANVFCRMFNATAVIKATSDSYFGRHEVLLEEYFLYYYVKVLQLEFACIGTESSLVDCPARYLQDVGNQPGHDAGVECLLREEPDDFRVRLVGGKTPLDGNIEVFHDGGWGRIADSSGYPIVSNERSFADVVCRQLGQGYPIAWIHRPNDTEIELKMALTTCSGAERSLAQCVGVQWIDAVGVGYKLNVTCSGPVSRDEVTLRLNDFRRSPIDYDGSGHGYLEVFDGERFGTVCDEGWTVENANVVCRQLGYGPANPSGMKLYEGAFRLTRGPIFLSNFSCKGTEKSLKECSHGHWLEHECGHAKDVGVSCDVTSSGASVAVTSFVAAIFVVAISMVGAV